MCHIQGLRKYGNCWSQNILFQLIVTKIKPSKSCENEHFWRYCEKQIGFFAPSLFEDLSEMFEATFSLCINVLYYDYL